MSKLLLLSTLLCSSPPADSVKRVNLLPIPVLYYTPETRLAYGAAATTTFRFKNDTLVALPNGRVYVPHPSQVTVGIARTQNRQLAFYAPFQLFWKQDRYFLIGEVGYYRYNYYFFGLDDRPIEPERFGVNFPRIRLNAFRRVSRLDAPGRLFAGLRYQFEDYRVNEVEPEGVLASGTIPGGLGSRMSGLGPGLFYDTRDNLFYPSRGLIVDLKTLHHGRALGSNVTFDRWQADVSTYHKVSNRAILAVNYVVSITTGGTAPFNGLSLLGGPKRGRGYYEGRFRDDNLALVQAELRMNVWRRFGAVAFGSLGALGDRDRLFRVNTPRESYGAGLRYRINRDLVNLRIDYGFGRQSNGFYITIGEAF